MKGDVKDSLADGAIGTVSPFHQQRQTPKAGHMIDQRADQTNAPRLQCRVAWRLLPCGRGSTRRIVKHARVRRRIARRTHADRRLVNVDNLVDTLNPTDPFVSARYEPRAMDSHRQCMMENRGDQSVAVSRLQESISSWSARGSNSTTRSSKSPICRPTCADTPIGSANPRLENS